MPRKWEIDTMVFEPHKSHKLFLIFFEELCCEQVARLISFGVV